MRALLFLLLATSTAMASPKASDPPLLGVSYVPPQQPMPNQPAPPFGCAVTGITASSGAEAAGVRIGELIVKIGSAAIPTCNQLQDVVQSHAVGETITVELTTLSGVARKVEVQLSSRAEIARRDMLGKPLETELVSTDDRDALVLEAMRGRAVIVGFFSADCALECKAMFEKVATFQRKSKTSVQALAVTQRLGYGVASQQALTSLRDTYKLDIPLAVIASPTDPSMPTPPNPMLSLMVDKDRVMFTVVDARGNVSYVTPVAPGAEDLDAILEDLFVAADQAARRK